MPERKLFKTKLCQLYQKGRCTRRGCSFAHGEAELRRFSASYNAAGTRDRQGTDLRNKLDGKRISPTRYSPPRDTRGRYSTQEKSSSRSFEKTGDKKYRKAGHLSGQSDISGSIRFSYGNRDQAKGEKFLTKNPRDSIQEQMKKLEVDINVLDSKKRRFEARLEEKAREVDSLNSRIQELEAQLRKEDEECKRITSRIRKFVKVHRENSSLQDELKRSQARLQRLGDQLASDITKFGVNEEDLSVDIVSTVEHIEVPLKNIREQNNASPFIKRLLERDAPEASKKGKGGDLDVVVRPKKRSRWNVPALQINDMDDDSLDPRITKPRACKSKKGKYASAGHFSADKSKDSDSRPLVPPPTSMAAHAAYNEVEIEFDDKIEHPEAGYVGYEKDATYLKHLPPLPPPPLTVTNNYSQYEENDEHVDVDGPDVEENCNVDIV